MKTKKHKTPYWWQAIDAAEKRGGFSRKERSKSGNWVTCACGKQDKQIPRDYRNEPIDWQLRYLGSEFYNYVLGNNFFDARETLCRIEKRSAEILKGYPNENQS